MVFCSLIGDCMRTHLFVFVQVEKSGGLICKFKIFCFHLHIAMVVLALPSQTGSSGPQGHEGRYFYW